MKKKSIKINFIFIPLNYLSLTELWVLIDFIADEFSYFRAWTTCEIYKLYWVYILYRVNQFPADRIEWTTNNIVESFLNLF